MRYAITNKSNIVLLGIISLVLTIFGCHKEEAPALPTLKFATTKGFCSGDTTIKISDVIQLAVEAESPDSRITYFSYRKITPTDTIIVDSGMNVNAFQKIISITKGLSDWEKWEFRIRNKHNDWAIISLTITKDANSKFGKITTIPIIRLGAQNNTTYGSFFSIMKQAVYTLTEAYNSQTDIDLLYYYDFLQAEDNSIASPGASMSPTVYTGTMDVNNWTIRNETRFVQSAITTADFDKATDDSLLIANTFIYPNGKRKCKNLKVGDIYTFIRNNKTGMIKVLNVVGKDDGYIEFSIKVQQ